MPRSTRVALLCVCVLLLVCCSATAWPVSKNGAHAMRRARRVPVPASASASAPVAAPRTARDGPCPGLPLASCECFQRLNQQANMVANMTDIVQRNWWITLSYQDISHSFQSLLGLAPNGTVPGIGVWPSVAVWASRDVGFGIRGQTLQETAAYLFREFPQWLQELVQLVPDLLNVVFAPVMQRAAEGLGGGNQMVFEEIGLVYTAYGMEFCEQPTDKPEPERMQKFVQQHVCVEEGDGPDCMFGQSMWALWRAHFPQGELNATRSVRDQELLAQGLLTGLHEQTRLQPYINQSLPGYAEACWAWPAGLPNTTECIDPELINSLASQVTVHLLMGSQYLDTRNDIPSNIHGVGQPFSPDLANLTLPLTRSTMQSLLPGHDLSLSPLNGTAAQDWNVLSQRMRFVGPLFWVMQDHPDLNCYAFTAEQEAQIRSNQMAPLNDNTWKQICIEDCCSANGAWTGGN